MIFGIVAIIMLTKRWGKFVCCTEKFCRFARCVRKGGDILNTVITILISSLASMFSGIVLFLIQGHLKKQQKKDEEREEAKAHQMTLIIRTLISLGKLTVANSIALRDGHTNGELKAALKEYRDIEMDLFEYLAEKTT